MRKTVFQLNQAKCKLIVIADKCPYPLDSLPPKKKKKKKKKRREKSNTIFCILKAFTH